MSAKASTAELIRVARWLEKHRNEILNSRPNQRDLCERVKKELQLNALGVSALKQICGELNIVWVSSVRRSSANKEIQASLSILTDALIGLYQLTDAPIPSALTILGNTLRKNEDNGEESDK